MTPNEIETLRLLVTGTVPCVLAFLAVTLGPWLLWALWLRKPWRRVPVSGGESRRDGFPTGATVPGGESRIDPQQTRRFLAKLAIAELEPLINRYGAFLEVNAHLFYGIPESTLETTLETTPEELKAALLRYGNAIRDCNLLDEQTRQMLRNGYCELARVLQLNEDEGKEAVAAAEVSMRGGLEALEADNWSLTQRASAHLDRIAAGYIRLMHEFDSQFPPVSRPTEPHHLKEP